MKVLLTDWEPLVWTGSSRTRTVLLSGCGPGPGVSLTNEGGVPVSMGQTDSVSGPTASSGRLGNIRLVCLEHLGPNQDQLVLRLDLLVRLSSPVL